MKIHRPILVLAALTIGVFFAAPGETRERRVETIRAHLARDPDYARAGRTYFTATMASENDMLAFRRELIESGARHVNLFLPDVVVCELPRGMDVAALSSYPAVVRTDETAVAPYRVSGETGEASRESVIKFAYQSAERSIQTPPQPAPGTVHGFKDVVRTISPEKSREIQRRLIDAGVATEDERVANQNSEFWGGDILVQTIFMESSGEYEAKTESWSNQELTEAVSGVYTGMISVQQQFPNMPIHYVFEEYRRARTGFEPIKHNMSDDANWIIDTLKRLDSGLVGEDEITLAHHFNNKARARRKTDWVYTAFVANSENAPNHVFNTDQYTAYANLGGPYLVIPYPAGRDPNSIGTRLVFSQIFQHETGHIFWALDEYENSTDLCTATSGYLNYKNANKLSRGLEGELTNCAPEGILDCLMQNAARQDIGRPWCKYTRGQIGLIDSDENSIPDIYESEPVVEFKTAAVETVLTPEATIELRGVSKPVPNSNPRLADQIKIDYAAPLKAGEFTVGSAEPLDLVPDDGRWDETEEEATIHLRSLLAGRTTVDVRVENAVGIWTKPRLYRKTFFYIGVNYSHFSFTVGEGVITVAWNVLNDVFGAKFDVFRLAPGEDMPGQLVEHDVPVAGPAENEYAPYRYEDRNVDPGKTYKYYVEGYFTLTIDGEQRDFRSRTGVFEQTAMYKIPAGRIISSASPNPFRDKCMVSISVPQTFEESPSAGSGGGFVARVPTPVDVAVYDVLGRRVKTLRAGSEFSEVITLSWDGTNNKNDRVPSGVYFLRVNAGGSTGVQKLILVR